MATDFRFTLEKGSKKHPCPACGKKTFVRYVDTETGEYIQAEHGRCDRAENCGYHLNPYKDGFATNQGQNRGAEFHQISPKKGLSGVFKTATAPVLIEKSVLEATIKNPKAENVFLQNLLHRVPFPFEPGDVERVADLYHLGTVANGYRAGALTIPYIDEMGGCRFIQVKSFDQDNHTKGPADSLTSIIARHHQKTGTDLPGWLEAYQKQDLKVSTLFGAHLLPNHPQNRIAMCEAPKTAIYGTLYFGFPDTANDRLWMAVYSRDSLTVEKCKAIQGRTVYLFPDLSKDGSTFKLWQAKADEIMKALPGTRIVVSTLLEEMAGSDDRVKGADMADYLIRCDWRQFRQGRKGQQEAKHETYQVPDQVCHIEKQKPYSPRLTFRPGAWDQDITEIDLFFESAKLPPGPILLNGIYPITDINGFLKANLEPARAQSGNPTYLPYLTRVKALIEYLTNPTERKPIKQREVPELCYTM
jgi:hypothetical protein